MNIRGKVHCFFEQSGTFKNEFKKLGIPAEDYDIQNNFVETDHVIDLFAEIEKGYSGGGSVFDTITQDDLIFAFFPCIYFCQQNTTFFDGTNINWKGYTLKQKADEILKRSTMREKFYEIAIKLFTLCAENGKRLIVENPYSTIHYLHNNFLFKPNFIDENRQLRGDYFRKPTQYWFVNCKPTQGFSFQQPKKKLKISSLTGHIGSLCDEKRSLISPDYARNFICDFIIGKEQEHSQPQLFKEG